MGEQTKVALISGANKGIGLETARQLGKQGITVLIGARDLAKGEAAAAELKKEGIDAQAVKFDVVNDSDVKAAAAKIEKEYGKLDILVNNAGVSLEPFGPNVTSTTLAGCFAEDVGYEFLCGGVGDADAVAAAEEECRWPDCECVEHSGVAFAAGDGRLADL